MVFYSYPYLLCGLASETYNFYSNFSWSFSCTFTATFANVKCILAPLLTHMFYIVTYKKYEKRMEV